MDKTITFDVASPTPSCGYRFRYRLQGSTGTYTVVTGSNPLYLTGLPVNTIYEYILDSDCCSGLNSTGKSGTFSTSITNNSFNTENTNVTGGQISGVSPVVYIIDTGSFPLQSGQSISAIHTGFTAAISVGILGTFSESRLYLYKGASLIETINVTTAGNYTFAYQSFSSTEPCTIRFQIYVI